MTPDPGQHLKALIAETERQIAALKGRSDASNDGIVDEVRRLNQYRDHLRNMLSSQARR